MTESSGLAASSTPGYAKPAVRGAWVAAAACLVSVAYLGGLRSLLPFAIFGFGFLLPMAALYGDLLRGSGISDDMRVCAAAALGLLSAIPAYYLRRLVGPLAGDFALIAAPSALAWWRGSTQRYVRAAASPTFRDAGWLVTGVVPAICCLVWLGFEVPSDGAVRYYGLFTIDFGNLAGIVALIKASPGAPLWMTEGGGPLHYHWWFFAIPAWLSELGGFELRASSALVLSNLLSAMLLAATLCAALSDYANREGFQRPRWFVPASAAVVMFAPFSNYAYQFIAQQTAWAFFNASPRNSLMLTVVNSLVSFGNNTLALVALLIIIASSESLSRAFSPRAAALASVCGFAVLGLSVTLAMPLALASALWFALGKFKRPLYVVAIAGVVAVAGLPLLRLSHIIGDSTQHLKIAFDGGVFIQTVLFGMAPVWTLVAASLWTNRALSFCVLLLGSAVLVPTLVDIVGDGAVSSTMSMKTASLIAIASAPLALDALHTVYTRARPVWKAAVGAMLLLGVTNASAYVLQFGFCRLTDRGIHFSLPSAYVSVLHYVREHTRKHAVVLDPYSDSLPNTVATLLVGERKVYLPTIYSVDQFKADIGKPQLLARRELFRAWAQGAFRDEAQASELARESDVLILTRSTLQSASWKPREQIGSYTIYSSQLRRGGWTTQGDD